MKGERERERGRERERERERERDRKIEIETYVDIGFKVYGAKINPKILNIKRPRHKVTHSTLIKALSPKIPHLLARNRQTYRSSGLGFRFSGFRGLGLNLGFRFHKFKV